MNRIAAYGLAIWLLAWPFAAQAAPVLKQEPLSIGKHSFTVEIAETQEQQKLGLMHRTSLAKNRGMLFIQTEDRVLRMWMKDTLIPLDMLFIDKRGEIVYIAENTTPESTAIISSKQPVRAVLELRGGTVKNRHIHTGDHVMHHYFKP